MNGKIFIIGIGPGNNEQMSLKALKCIEECDPIIGFRVYLKLISKLIQNKKVIASGMKHEKERCEIALDYALKENKVGLISGGDPGVYGIAGIMLEILNKRNSNVDVEIIPGITSSSAAAALLGAPIMHDHAIISLSDLLTDWKIIENRIKNAAKADFVICLYNPKSKKRITQIEIARKLLMVYRKKDTPVGIVKNATRNNEEIIITTLEDFLSYDIDMKTIVLIGNSQTYVKNNKMITPRGYIL